MADPVSLVFVDEDDLVGLRDRLCTASVLYVRAAIGEHQMRRRDAFLSALVPACALAHHVPYRDRIGRQEGASVEVGHVNASRSSRRSIATSMRAARGFRDYRPGVRRLAGLWISDTGLA